MVAKALVSLPCWGLEEEAALMLDLELMLWADWTVVRGTSFCSSSSESVAGKKRSGEDFALKRPVSGEASALMVSR